MDENNEFAEMINETMREASEGIFNEAVGEIEKDLAMRIQAIRLLLEIGNPPATLIAHMRMEYTNWTKEELSSYLAVLLTAVAEVA